jgi:hypothetical protein
MLARIMGLLPLRMRDWAYNIIARHRFEFLDAMRVVRCRVRRIANDSWISKPDVTFIQSQRNHGPWLRVAALWSR